MYGGKREKDGYFTIKDPLFPYFLFTFTSLISISHFSPDQTKVTIRMCLVGVKTGRMENVVFHYLVGGRKIWEKENIGENFPSWAHFFYPPKSVGKCGEKSAVKALLHKFPVSLSSHGYKHNNLSLKHL